MLRFISQHFFHYISWLFSNKSNVNQSTYRSRVLSIIQKKLYCAMRRKNIDKIKLFRKILLFREVNFYDIGKCIITGNRENIIDLNICVRISVLMLIYFFMCSNFSIYYVYIISYAMYSPVVFEFSLFNICALFWYFCAFCCCNI